MSEDKFELEHFYYGHLVKGDQPDGTPQVLSTSPGLSTKLAEVCVERITLPGLPAAEGHAWALVRGRSRQTPFILIQSQLGAYGQAVAHYIIFQPEALKAMGGSTRALRSLVEAELPVFKDTWQKLKRLELTPVAPRTIDEQVDDILELMTITQNRTQLIEPLLAAIVEGRQLVVTHAPQDFDQRLKFITGLLALLPSSTRFGVTFATHSLPVSQVDTQIRFVDGSEPSGEGLAFDWAAARITGESEVDEYSRYIISQLRLDAALVIERNSMMASVAGWRLNEGDKLADALGYAAKRFKLDEALHNNQPINKDEVAKVLVDDPTLSPELRKLYAAHLLRFSLAMNDMSHAEPVAVLLRAHQDLADFTLQQMEEALRDGQGELLLETLIQWMNNPLGPEGDEWIVLTHRTIEAVIQLLAEEEAYEDLSDTLIQLIEAGPALAIEDVVQKLVGALLPHTRKDEETARYTYLLGVKYLDADGFKRLMGQSALVDNLPAQVKHTWAYIQSGRVDEAPEGFLVKTAKAFGDDWEPLVLLRLIETAVQSGAKTAIDEPTVRNLRSLAASEHAGQYKSRILPVIDLVDDDMLVKLGDTAPTYLLQTRLALGDYAGVAKQMIHQSMLLYAGDKQADYLNSIYYVFADTPLPEATTLTALRSVHENGIKSLPYAVAIIGALNGLEASPALTEIAGQAADYLLNTDHIHEVVPPAAAMALLKFYSDARDVQGMMKASSIVPRIAIRRGSRGVKLLAETYKQLDWNEAAQQAALQMLKVFIRGVPLDVMPKAVDYFAKELGEEIGAALTVTARLRQAMAGRSILKFAPAVRAVIHFMHDSTALYAEKAQPNPAELIASLDDMTGAPSAEDRRMAAKMLEQTGAAVIALAEKYRAGRGRDDENTYIDGILRARTDPRSGLDVMRMVAGILARGKRIPLDVPSRSPKQVLSIRSADEWLAEIRAAGETLVAMNQAFSTVKVGVTAAALKEELRSIWDELDAEDQNLLRRTLAMDLQRLADLIVRIEGEADVKSYHDSNLIKRIQTGKHKPRNTLEFWRLLQGYYNSRI